MKKMIRQSFSLQKKSLEQGSLASLSLWLPGCALSLRPASFQPGANFAFSAAAKLSRFHKSWIKGGGKEVCLASWSPLSARLKQWESTEITFAQSPHFQASASCGSVETVAREKLQQSANQPTPATALLPKKFEQFQRRLLLLLLLTYLPSLLWTSYPL